MNRSLVLLVLPCVLLGLALWCFVLSGPETSAGAIAPAAPHREAPAVDVAAPVPWNDTARREDRGAAQGAPTAAVTASALPAARALPPLSPPPAGGLPLGVVLQVDGSPVAGADVLVLDFHDLTSDLSDVYEDPARLEELVYERGQRYQSGADGIALIDPPLEQGYAIGLADNLFGSLWFGGYQQGRAEIELAPDLALVVDVVDERDQPLAGREVLLNQIEDSWRWTRLKAVTDEHGRARMAHAGFANMEGRDGTRFRVELAAAASEPIGVDLARDAWPESALRIVAPALGALEVAVVGPDGQPHVEPVLLYLRLRRPVARQATEAEREAWDQLSISARTVDGRARFAAIEPGMVCVVTGGRHQGAKWNEVEMPGPRLAEETAQGEFKFADDVPVLGMLVTDEAGTPLVDAVVAFGLQVASEQGSSQTGGRLTTDAAGRLEFDCALDWEPGGTRELTLRHVLVTRQSLQAKLDLSRLLPHGLQDLGEVRLAGDAPLVAGTALDGAGQPLGGVHVSLQTKVSWGTSEQFYWQPIWNVDATSKEDGSFAVYGAADAEEVQVVGRRAYHATERVTARLGDAGIVLRLGKSGSILGSVLLPERVTRDDLWIDLRDENARAELGYDWYTRPQPRFRSDGRFEIVDVAPGSYVVDLWANGPNEPVASVAGVRVGPGEEARDPRLQEVDLRQSLRVIEIRLIVPPGADPAPEGNCQFREAGSSDRENDAWAEWRDGRFRLLASFPAIDVDLWCAPYRAERLLGLDRDVELALSLGPTVRLVLAEPELVPPGYTLVANLTYVAGVLGNSWNAFEAGPQIDVALASPGRWQVDWMLTRDSENGSTTVGLDSGEQPLVIEVADTPEPQTFRVMPSKESIELVLAEFEPQDG